METYMRFCVYLEHNSLKYSQERQVFETKVVEKSEK
jgi:hypothetical protein